MADKLQSLELRLWAACFAFVLAGTAFDSIWLLQMAGAAAFAACAFFASKCIAAVGSVPTITGRCEAWGAND